MLFNYQEYQNQQKENHQKPNNFNNSFNVSYFDLPNDGDEAIVRFVYSSTSEFDLANSHRLQIKGKWRKINCLNDSYSVDKCPLCSSGNKAEKKFFIKLIQYVRKEDGSIGIQPKIWERSCKYADTLNNLFNEYGNISDCIFKIKRTGAKGDMRTKYDIMYASPAVYKPELYLKDFSGFDNFKISDYIVLSKTAEEMEELLNPVPVEETQQTVNNYQNTTQPQYNPTPSVTPVNTTENQEKPWNKVQPAQPQPEQNNNDFSGAPRRTTYNF
jgi:hypothetical protein